MENALRDTLERSPRPPRRNCKNQFTVEVSQSTNQTDPVLSLTNLSVKYGQDGATKTVVDSVSLDLGKGEIVGLVGESGSGKSQTAFSILGLLPQEARITGGSLSIALTGLPQDSLHHRALGRSIAYVAQEPMSNLDPSFTVGQQLTYGLRAATGISKSEARERLLALLGRVGIVDPVRTFDSYPHEISGGMAQRVLIAGAVAPRPEILIADEPTTALDVTVQAEILELIRDLQAEMGMSVLLVTHNLGVVADICDRVVVMHSGRIVESGSTEQLFAAPHELYTRRLLDAVLDVDIVRDPLPGNV